MARTQARFLKSCTYSGTQLEDINVKLRLSVLKLLHAAWVVNFYNFIISAEGKEVNEWKVNEWKALGIYDAIRLGTGKFPVMDTYHDIDSLVNESNIPKGTNLEDVRQLNQGKLNLFHIREDKNEYDDDEEDPWEPEIQTSNAFDIFQGFDDEQSLLHHFPSCKQNTYR